jgi:beta-1,4-mannosyl-glycoprotein beta-1,4-N-acetylglucosaminyltransferase
MRFSVCCVFLLCILSVCEAKVYDCFPFFNELDLLELRLNELDSVVDYFVIVEAPQTFQGKDKPLYFQKNRQRFKKFKHKIIPIVIPKCNQSSPWIREARQRNAIMQGLKKCQPDDLIFISDVDEIIRASKIKEISDSIFIEHHKAVSLVMPMYRFYMNTFDQMWPVARATTYQHLKSISPEQLRIGNWMAVPVTKRIENCGWHFTSIGGLEQHRLKTESYSHAERNHEEYKSQKFVESWIQKFTIAEIDDTFPQYMRDHLDQYDHYLYKPGRRYN